MTEMGEEEIQERFEKLVEAVGGKQKPVAQMETASELLDEQQRLLAENRRLMDFKLDLHLSRHQLYTVSERYVHVLEDLNARVQQFPDEAQHAGEYSADATDEIGAVKEEVVDVTARLHTMRSRVEQHNAHERRIEEFHAEILNMEAAVTERRVELGV